MFVANRKKRGFFLHHPAIFYSFAVVTIFVRLTVVLLLKESLRSDTAIRHMYQQGWWLCWPKNWDWIHSHLQSVEPPLLQLVSDWRSAGERIGPLFHILNCSGPWCLLGFSATNYSYSFLSMEDSFSSLSNLVYCTMCIRVGQCWNLKERSI